MIKVAEKQSKFEKRLITKMDAEKNKEEIAKRSYRRASNLIKLQINALEIKRTDLEITIEDKQDWLDDTLYCTNFTIARYDEAKINLNIVQDQLADVEATLELRRNLLKELE